LGKVNATQFEIEQAAKEANAHEFIMALSNVCLIFLKIASFTFI